MNCCRQVNEDTESLMLTKTTVLRYSDLRAFVLDHHPYDLSEIIALPVDAGLDGYLKWVAEEVG